MNIYRTTMQTPHFIFEAYGATEEDANEAMGRAINRHTDQYSLDSEWWSDYEQVTEPFELNCGYRDGSKLTD